MQITAPFFLIEVLVKFLNLVKLNEQADAVTAWLADNNSWTGLWERFVIMVQHAIPWFFSGFPGVR